MFEFPNTALTVFAVLIANPQGMFSPLLTAAFAVICILAILFAVRGERRRD